MEIWKRPSTTSWAFARRGAQRNPSATGGPYICEQCRLDSRTENDRTSSCRSAHYLSWSLRVCTPFVALGLLEKPEAKD